ncbi:3-hydroxyisobutyrate dehydrogenase [Mycena filopes]|nr:3-hydroxyisobutyrate dehydrogenase [Mycena filopes]
MGGLLYSPSFPRVIVRPDRLHSLDAEILVTALSGRHVKEVYLTPDTGILAANTSGKLLIDCSTIDIATSLAVGEAVLASNPPDSKPAIFFDSPASDDPLFPSIQTILKAMGKVINPMGGKGLGLAAKLSNNYLSGIIALATSEAMNLGMKLGIDAKVLSDCFQSGSSANWVNATYPACAQDAVTSKEYEGGFKVQLMEKDMKLAVAAASDVGARLVLGETTIGAYSSAANDSKYRDHDSRIIYKWCARC